MERILFPDAVAVAIGAVRTQLPELGFAGVAVRSRVPNPRPARFVRIWRTGGPRRNIVVDAAQLTIDAWGSNDAEAHDLAQAARAIVNSLEGTVVAGVTLYSIQEFAGPADLPDPDSDQPRYRWTTSVNTRGAAA